MNHDRPTSFRPRCPSCDRMVDPQESHDFLPFCSQRCRIIDLGRWLNEEHRLTCEPVDEEETEVAPIKNQVKLPPGWHDA